MSRAYLDHASSTPLRPAAFDAMLPYLRDHHADPGRLHAEGAVTRVALEEARAEVAALLGCRPRELVFTSSGTEAVNAAVFGATARHRERTGTTGRVVTTAVEHSSVLESADRHGGAVVRCGVDRLGRYDPGAVLDAVDDDTALVAVQLANHEVGTRQPAAEVVAGCRDRGVTVFVDACAAAGHVGLDLAALGADLVAVSAHTLGGPKGAAALVVRRGLRVPPLVLGGAQERARRAGMEDVAAAVGFGAACRELAGPGPDRTGTLLEAEATTARERTERLARAACAVAGVVRLGDPDDRLPHLVCIGIDGVEAEPVLVALDRAGVAVHSGSSCSSETLEPSPVLAAMGVDAERSLRASVGWSTVDDDIARFATAFPEAVARLRALRA